MHLKRTGGGRSPRPYQIKLGFTGLSGGKSGKSVSGDPHG